MKNAIYAGVIVVCIVVALLVFLSTRGGGGAGVNSVSDTKQVWVKCGACSETWEMSERQFYRDLEEKAKQNPAMMVTPGLDCPKCAKPAGVKAFKCEKCGVISFSGAVSGDFPDRCPKCNHSATEALREARKKGLSQP